MSDMAGLFALSLSVLLWGILALARAISDGRRKRRIKQQADQEYAETLRRFEERKRREWRGK